jgi:hypothetical protein
MVPNGFPLSGHAAWTLLAQAPQHSGEIVFTIRVWHYSRWAGFYGGGFSGAPAMLGDSVAVGNWVALQKDEAFLKAAPVNLTALLSLLAGLGALLLYAKDRASGEYLWFGVMETAYGLSGLWMLCVGQLFALGINRRELVGESLREIVLVASILFLFRFVDRPVTRWARWFLFAQIPFFILAEVNHYGGGLSIGQMSTIQTLNMLLWYGTLLWVVFRFWKHSRGARLLAVPLLLVVVANFVPAVYSLVYRVGWTTWQTPLVPISNFQFVYAWVAQLIYLAAVAYFLIERFAETRAERTRLQDEFEAARTVQQVLIPDFLPPVAGLMVKSAYLPAQEVGGDFFQVLPLEDGSAFIVVGDVSGKGLAGGDDGVVAGGDAAHAGGVCERAGRDVGGAEPAAAWAGCRVRDVPGDEDRAGGRGDAGECGASEPVSGWDGGGDGQQSAAGADAGGGVRGDAAVGGAGADVYAGDGWGGGGDGGGDAGAVRVRADAGDEPAGGGGDCGGGAGVWGGRAAGGRYYGADGGAGIDNRPRR